MIDLSDGLLIDTDRLCAASRVAARVDADRLPLAPPLRALAPPLAWELALGGGEDYELLFAVRPARIAALGAAGASLGCRVTEIGEIVPGRGVTVTSRGRVLTRGAALGHQHFTTRSRRRGADGR